MPSPPRSATSSSSTGSELDGHSWNVAMTRRSRRLSSAAAQARTHEESGARNAGNVVESTLHHHGLRYAAIGNVGEDVQHHTRDGYDDDGGNVVPFFRGIRVEIRDGDHDAEEEHPAKP